jgi:hypothetical protein
VARAYEYHTGQAGGETFGSRRYNAGGAWVFHLLWIDLACVAESMLAYGETRTLQGRRELAQRRSLRLPQIGTAARQTGETTDGGDT